MNDVFGEDFLLQSAQIVSKFKQQHTIKAAACCLRLSKSLPSLLPSDFVALKLALELENEPRVRSLVSATLQSPQKIASKRAMGYLNEGVFPMAYLAVQAWEQELGVENIFAHYMPIAAANPLYLGHGWSVLLGFREAYDLFNSPKLKPFYLERLAEFLVTSFSVGDKQQVYSDRAALRMVSPESALDICSIHPGFYGHNIIALSYSFANRSSLSSEVFAASLAGCVREAQSIHHDADDNVTLTDSELNIGSWTFADLQHALSSYWNKPVANIHVATLSDAVVRLWDLSNEIQKKRFLALLALHTKA